MQRQLHSGVLARRGNNPVGAMHARTPATVSELRSGWEIFLQFALEVDAIELSEKQELGERCERALGELATLQVKYQEAGDPGLRFIALLRAALAGGGAHLADRQGREPKSAELWGWRWKPTGRQGMIPMGTRIGWVVGSDLFLDATASYQVAQQVAGAGRLAVSEQTLRHRLRDCGLLASIDVGRQMLLVRRTLEGRPREVLHLKTSHVIGQ